MLRPREVCDLPKGLQLVSAGLDANPSCQESINVNVAQENHSAKVNPILLLPEAGVWSSRPAGSATLSA